MKRTSVFMIVACLALPACDRDPASNVKIIARPAAVSDSAATPIMVAFRPELCVLPPEDSVGKSTFVAKGPCSFRHEASLRCRRSIDDFYVAILRKAPGDATVAVYINVETYKGPGRYKNTQMFLTVQDGISYYHWSNDSVSISVGPREQFVDLPTVHLEAEPPNTGTEIVTGKLWCQSLAKSTTDAIPR